MNDILYMRRCLELAQMGLGHVSPNPLVGSVIVHRDKIIGEGYHHEYGSHHAEINALRSIKDQSLLKESTLYVSLEPCSHVGKTPPCADTICSMSIPRVVISCEDPNPLVSGKGTKKLRDAGIEVETGLLSKEYRWVNRRFFTFYEKQRPYIILKWAQSSDGFIDVTRKINDPTINWISSPFNRTLVHKWRSEEMAILVGSKTVISDNPQLTVRFWKGKNPLRIVIQTNTAIDLSNHVFNQEATTLRFTQNEHLKKINNVTTIVLNKEKNLLESMLAYLYQEKIISILVEGGRYTLQSFINKNLWDEARVFSGETTFENGIKAPVLPFPPDMEEHIANDLLRLYVNNS